jgi:hypothetical protein
VKQYGAFPWKKVCFLTKRSHFATLFEFRMFLWNKMALFAGKKRSVFSLNAAILRHYLSFVGFTKHSVKQNGAFSWKKVCFLTKTNLFAILFEFCQINWAFCEPKRLISGEKSLFSHQKQPFYHIIWVLTTESKEIGIMLSILWNNMALFHGKMSVFAPTAAILHHYFSFVNQTKWNCNDAEHFVKQNGSFRWEKRSVFSLNAAILRYYLSFVRFTEHFENQKGLFLQKKCLFYHQKQPFYHIIWVLTTESKEIGIMLSILWNNMALFHGKRSVSHQKQPFCDII